MPSANVTDALDNLTLAFQSFVNSFDTYNTTMSSLVSAINNLPFAMFFELLLLLGILAIAFWQKELIFWMLSGVITLVIGMLWVSDYPGVAVMMWFLSGYEVVRGFMGLIKNLGPSKGYSQFKEWYRKARRG